MSDNFIANIIIYLMSMVFVLPVLYGFLSFKINIAFILPNLFVIYFSITNETIISAIIQIIFLFILFINKDFAGKIIVVGLILMLLINVIYLFVSMFKYFYITINNIYILWAILNLKLLIDDEYKFTQRYKMSPQEAKWKIRKEKIAEWGARAATAYVFNIFSFVLKPITDELGHRFFGSTQLREDVKNFFEQKEFYLNQNILSIISTYTIVFFCGLREYHFTLYKMSYLYMISIIVDLIKKLF